MYLEDLYNQIEKAIKKVDFEKLWHGFKPFKFALYNEEECYFNGEYIEKTSEFVANTAIIYNGEYIAIWNAQEDMEIDIFASKMIHEMFHAFQYQNDWPSFPKEMEALFRYKYNKENLSIKLHENELLLELAECFDRAKYNELLKCRKYRSQKYVYEYQYEACVEDIEGSASYVEWMVLKQLNPQKADMLFEDMKATMIQSEYFFPIRISSYYTGALMINCVLQALDEVYNPAVRPLSISLVEQIDFENISIENHQVTKALEDFQTETERIINSALELNEIVLDGPAVMKCVNIYNARHKEEYITSTFFLAFTVGEKDQVKMGNFVIKMADEHTIEKVYHWPM